MSRVIATNEIKEEFDDVLETPLANFPFEFDESSESSHELQAAQVYSTSTTASNNPSPQLPGENDDQNCATKSNTASDDSMTEVEEEEIASKPPTGSNQKNLTKRKQSKSNRSLKKSKKTVEDEGEENIANEDRDDAKLKVLYLNCTQANCGDKLDSLDQLHGHLRNKHGLAPLPCFCGCKSRFDSSWQIFYHLQDRSSSKFLCPVCTNVYNNQHKTYQHWFYEHLTGQFQCNIDHCCKVVDTRKRLYSHQELKHCPESKRHECPHDGCSSSFVHKNALKIHEMIHLNTKPFHCKWPKCVHRANIRSNLIKHVRNMHFKKQQANGIVGERDPNKYVQLVKK